MTTLATSAAAPVVAAAASAPAPTTAAVAANGAASAATFFNDALSRVLGEDDRQPAQPSSDADEDVAGEPDAGQPLVLPGMLAVLMTLAVAPPAAAESGPASGSQAPDDGGPLSGALPASGGVPPAATAAAPLAVPLDARLSGSAPAAAAAMAQDAAPGRSESLDFSALSKLADRAEQPVPQAAPAVAPSGPAGLLAPAGARTDDLSAAAPDAAALPSAGAAPAVAKSAARTEAQGAVSVDSRAASPAAPAFFTLAAADASVADPVVTLANGDPARWRSPLLQALGDRLQMSRADGSDSAVIRLDPPLMGRIEIAIRQEAGVLQINLSATHNEVLRQLQGIGENLRHDLAQRHPGEVSVQVGESSPSRFTQGEADRQRHRQQPEQEPGRALGPANNLDETAAFALANDQESMT